MSFTSRLRSRPVVAVLVGGALLVGAPLAYSAATSSTPTPAQTATLSPQEKALLASSSPKDILMDPKTGDILSVTPASPGTGGG